MYLYYSRIYIQIHPSLTLTHLKQYDTPEKNINIIFREFPECFRITFMSTLKPFANTKSVSLSRTDNNTNDE